MILCSDLRQAILLDHEKLVPRPSGDRWYMRYDHARSARYYPNAADHVGIGTRVFETMSCKWTKLKEWRVLVQ